MPESHESTKPQKPRWKFWLRVVAVVVLAYLVGYFALMDRHRPTSPLKSELYFQSSFRWGGQEWVWIEDRATGDRKHIAYPNVTLFLNVIYEPMDGLYFWMFPRTWSEVMRLRDLGYP